MPNLGNLLLIPALALVLAILSLVPTVGARDAGIQKELCEIVCDPIAEGKDHPAEQACIQLCTDEKGVARIAAKWVQDGAGTVLRGVKPLIKPLVDLNECASLCGAATDAGKVLSGRLIEETASQGWKIAAAKAAVRGACVLPSQGGKLFGPFGSWIGYGTCMACCQGLKWTGQI